MANHLSKRGEIYYAEVIVPKDVRAVLGKSVFRKSTGNRKLKNAELTAGPWVQHWWKLINEARANPDAAMEKLASLMALHSEQDATKEYFDIQHEYNSDGKKTGRRAGWTDAEIVLEDYLTDLQIKLPPTEYQKYHDIYSGKTGVPLGLFVDRWISDNYSRSKARTQKEASTAIAEVTQYFPTLTDFTIPNRKRWLRDENRAKKTVQKHLGYVRSYFQWLRENQHVGESAPNPFIKDDIVWPKRLAEKQSYVPFSVAEVVQLRQAALTKGDVVLVRFMDIAQYTGMRLAEVAQTSKASVIVQDGIQCLKVKDDAKTAASRSRVVPIAKTLLDRVDLFSVAAPVSSAYEGQEVGKRFGRLKSALGFDRQHAFHSIRKTAATVFEQAGISEGITADIVGHEKQTMTYGLYSGGTSIVQRKQAIDQFEVLMLKLEQDA